MAPKHAMEMLVTGEFISAVEAQHRGLINRAVAPDALDAAVHLLTEHLAKTACGLGDG
jgi:enoyl-CoA hydratase/carnithine racemase